MRVAPHSDSFVLIEKNGTERLYFVVETKASLFAAGLRGDEQAKIRCGKAHFQALAADSANSAQFAVGRNLEDLLAQADV